MSVPGPVGFRRLHAPGCGSGLGRERRRSHGRLAGIGPGRRISLDRFLDSLASNPTADENTVAKELVNSYSSFYQGSGRSGQQFGHPARPDPGSWREAASKALAQAFLDAPSDSSVARARDSALAIFSGGGEVNLGDFLRWRKAFPRGGPGKSPRVREALSSYHAVFALSGERIPRAIRVLGLVSEKRAGILGRALDYSGTPVGPGQRLGRAGLRVLRNHGGGKADRSKVLPGLPGEQNDYALSWGASYAPARVNVLRGP